MSVNEVICGDSLSILSTLPRAQMIFADPPDNIGMDYDAYHDTMNSVDYRHWLDRIITAGSLQSEVFWLSYYYKYQPDVLCLASTLGLDCRQFIWRFTFGQHRNTDCGNGYRPLLRVAKPHTSWNADAIRIQSARQRLGDRRANPLGRVPDDVWEFPRVVGNASERRPWISNQHPEALIERMVLMSTSPGDLVIDMFAGSGTVHRVCKRLDLDSISIDLSPAYVKHIQEDT